MLKILTIHEAYPGHYVQLEYSNRCPSPIRKVLSSGTFAEGWAVYTEQMMLDQGFGQGDLGLRLHQLKFYLRAVINAILDHKMHVGALTDAEALDLLMNRAFQTEGEAVGKIIRAKQTSCQLSTYFVGRMAFHRLRQDIGRELGDRFDLSRYPRGRAGPRDDPGEVPPRRRAENRWGSGSRCVPVIDPALPLGGGELGLPAIRTVATGQAGQEQVRLPERWLDSVTAGARQEEAPAWVRAAGVAGAYALRPSMWSRSIAEKKSCSLALLAPVSRCHRASHR